tara:strand:- start:12237 stop:13478 length:1242 start_codon:yes stop_codon:yes gene_type:complete
MDDLYGSIEETTLNDDLLDEEGLRQWFKKGGWRQAGGKYDGKPCARQPGQKTTPKCVSRKKYSSMSKKERESAGRRKRKKDPGQTKKSGAAKPTYVKTDPQKGGRKKKSKKNEELYMDLEQIIQEELEAVIDEKRKKKKKKGGKKDACYHKVKSRYKVWPSAYASGALVKCRKVGAKNWGNSTKEELEINIHNELDLIVQESHSAADEKKLKKIAKQLRNSTKMHADQAEDIEDIINRSPDNELKEEENDKKDDKKKSKKSKKPKIDLHGFASEEEAAEYIKKNPSFFNEGMNCGCGNDPCDTYGENGKKIVIMVKEELQNVIDEKKKKKKSAKDRMKCNSSRRIRKGEPGYGKKKFVVKACEGGTEKIIRYGDANMEIKKDSPKRRKSFRARHNCKNPGSKLKARYWSCKKW